MDANLKIGVTTNGGKTINELESNIKELRAEFKATKIGTVEYTIAAKELTKALEAKTTAMKAVQTQNGKLMESYFTLGEQLRRTNASFMSFNQVIQDAPFGIRGVANNIQFLTQQFAQLRSAGMSTKEILIGMMKNALSPMGALMLGVSVATSALTIAMDKLGTTTEGTSNELQVYIDKWTQLQDLLYKNKELSEAERRRQLQASINEAETNLRLAKNPAAVKTVLVDPESGMSTVLTSPGKRADQKEILDLELKRAEAVERLRSFEQQVTQEKEKQDRLNKKAEKDENDALLRRIRSNVSQREWEAFKSGEKTQQGTPIYGMMKAQKGSEGLPWGIVPGVRMPKDNLSANEDKRIQKQTEDNLRQTMDIYNSVFFDPLRASFDAVASGSKSMADAFVESIKRMITQLLEFAAASLILSAFGFGTPMTNFKMLSGLGGLKSSIPTPVSVSGGEDIVSASVGRSLAQPRTVVEFVGKTKGEDIYYVQQSFLSKRGATLV